MKKICMKSLAHSALRAGSGLLLTMVLLCSTAEAGKVGADCRLGGKPLYGRVQEVSAFPDLKVKVVDSFPDLRVKQVSAFPDSCGKWQMVDSFPDLKIQYVDSFPDLTIRFDDAIPGVP